MGRAFSHHRVTGVNNTIAVRRPGVEGLCPWSRSSIERFSSPSVKCPCLFEEYGSGNFKRI